MPQRNVASNFTFEQQRVEINELAADFWTQKGVTDAAAASYLLKDGTNAFTGGTLNVPAAFTINSNSGAGTVTIAGNLQVDGTTTTLNSTTLEIADKNIIVAKGSANDAAADGAGLTVDSGGGDKTFNFVDAKDAFVSNIRLESTNVFTVTGTEGLSASLYLIADDGDDNGDGWRINSNQDDNDLTISNNTSGSYVDKLTLTNGGNLTATTFTGNGDFVSLDVDGTTDLDVTNVDGVLTMMGGWNLAFQNGFNNKTSAIVNSGASGKSNLEFKVDDGNGLDKRLSILNTGTVRVNKGGGIGMALVPASNTDTFQIQFDLADTTNKGYINYDFNTNRMKFRAGGSGEVFTLSNGGGILASSGSTNGGVLDLTSTQTSNQTWRLAVGGGDNAYVQGRGFFIRDENASATRFTINDGRVGINKVNPQRALDIETLNNENGFCLNTIGTAANYQFDLRDDGVVQLRVDPTGKISIGEDEPDGNHVLIRGSSTVGTKNGHIMLTGDGADVGQGPQIVFSEAGGGDNWAGGYVGFKRTGGGSVGDLVFGTRTATGDVNTIPTEQLKINSGGDLFVHNGFVQISPSDHDKLKLTVPSGSSDDWAYMTFWGEDGTRNAYVGTNAAGDVKVSRDGGCNLELGANAVFNGLVSDSKGDVRAVPASAGSGNYTLVASDAGKHVNISGSSATITVPAGVFSAGDVITFIRSTGDATVGTIDVSAVTCYSSADGTTTNRTLAARGMATMICTSPNYFYISGAGMT